GRVTVPEPVRDHFGETEWQTADSAAEPASAGPTEEPLRMPNAAHRRPVHFAATSPERFETVQLPDQSQTAEILHLPDERSACRPEGCPEMLPAPQQRSWLPVRILPVTLGSIRSSRPPFVPVPDRLLPFESFRSLLDIERGNKGSIQHSTARREQGDVWGIFPGSPETW